jgi:hypothetical protein
MSDEDLIRFCAANDIARVEREADGSSTRSARSSRSIDLTGSLGCITTPRRLKEAELLPVSS